MSYSSEVLADSPLAYWRLGESAGATTIADTSGNSRTGSYVNSPALGASGAPLGDPDTAMSVSSSAYGSASSAWFGTRTTYSVEAWFKTSGSGNQMIVGYDNIAQSPGNPSRVFQLYLSGGQLIFLPLMSSGSYAVVISPGASYNNGAWHHVVATWDGSNAKLYADGSQVATAAITGTTTNGGGVPILIGAGYQNAPGNTYLFNGTLDEVAIYSTAITSTRVSAHYNAALDDGLAPTITQIVPYTENGNLHLLYLLGQGYGVPVTISVTGDLTQSFGPSSTPARSHVSLTGTSLGTTYNLTVTATNTYGSSSGYNLTYTHAANNFVNAVMQDTPAVYHLSDETAGTRVFDRSLNDRDGTYNGTVTLNDTVDPATGAAQMSRHVRLDGSTGYIRLDNGSWLTPASGFTFETVIYLRSFPNFSRIFDFANAPSTVDMLLTTSGSSNLRLYNGGNNNGTTSGTPVGSWAYLAVSVTGAGVATMYLNGATVATVSVGALLNGARAFKYIGKSGYADPYLPASIAHFAVYNQALSLTRLNAHYQAIGFPQSNSILSRESVTVLANDNVVQRMTSRTAAQVLAGDLVVQRKLSRMTLQVLVPTSPRFRGWGARK